MLSKEALPFVRTLDVSHIYGPFLSKLDTLFVALHTAGHDHYMVQGFRSVEEQDKLYAQGRTTPGQIVTKARGGLSAHNYGCAADLCIDADMNKPGLQPDWTVAHYRLLADEAKKLGLEAGLDWSTFKDAPHVQLPLSKHGITFHQLEQLYRASGMAGVVKLLDQFKW